MGEFKLQFLCCIQAMKNKQGALLGRLDALDEECGALKKELVQVERSREKLASDLKQVETLHWQVQTLYQQAQSQLAAEQVS